MTLIKPSACELLPSVGTDSIPAPTRPPSYPLSATFKQMLREELPNLLRLYLNPYVTQTCFCLTRYVQTAWDTQKARTNAFQTFLANGFDEALSGAIKLARYSLSLSLIHI